MKKIGLFPILILSFALVSIRTALAKNDLRLIKAMGKVNINDIGGSGLYVFSLWDKNKGAPIGADGSFVTVISDSNPQKLSVKDDKEMTRALTIALPEDSHRITFDAKSTAAAVLFTDPSFFRTCDEAGNIFKLMADKKSFQELVFFFKKNLPSKPLEELRGNPECIALLEKCNTEIFGDDQAAIRKSLYEAKDKLQKLLHEQ